MFLLAVPALFVVPALLVLPALLPQAPLEDPNVGGLRVVVLLVLDLVGLQLHCVASLRCGTDLLLELRGCDSDDFAEGRDDIRNKDIELWLHADTGTRLRLDCGLRDLLVDVVHILSIQILLWNSPAPVVLRSARSVSSSMPGLPPGRTRSHHR